MRVPDRIIEIEGTLLRADVSNDVEDVSIDDGPEQSDHFRLTVNNAHGRWTDLELFDEGNEVRLRLGYTVGPYLSLRGKIMAPGGNWPEAGEPTISVEGYDLGYAMGRSQKTRTWNNVRDSDIAARVAAEAGLKAIVQESPVIHEQLMQESISDLGFLFQRAKEWNFEVWINGDTLHFGKRGTGMPVDVFRWGHNIRSINLRKSVADIATLVVVKGWDPVRKYEVTGKVDKDAAGNLEVVGARITAEVFGQVQTFISREIPKSQEEAQEMAIAKFGDLAESYVEGEMTVEGDPRLRRGATIAIDGVGKRFKGIYMVTGSTHTIGSMGYDTSVRFNDQRQAG